MKHHLRLLAAFAFVYCHAFAGGRPRPGKAHLYLTQYENVLGTSMEQLWDGKEIIVSPKTDTYFYNEAQSYPVMVIKDKDGIVKQVTLLGTNVFNKVAE